MAVIQIFYSSHTEMEIADKRVNAVMPNMGANEEEVKEVKREELSQPLAINIVG